MESYFIPKKADWITDLQARYLNELVKKLLNDNEHIVNNSNITKTLENENIPNTIRLSSDHYKFYTHAIDKLYSKGSDSHQIDVHIEPGGAKHKYDSRILTLTIRPPVTPEGKLRPEVVRIELTYFKDKMTTYVSSIYEPRGKKEIASSSVGTFDLSNARKLSFFEIARLPSAFVGHPVGYIGVWILILLGLYISYHINI